MRAEIDGYTCVDEKLLENESRTFRERSQLSNLCKGSFQENIEIPSLVNTLLNLTRITFIITTGLAFYEDSFAYFSFYTRDFHGQNARTVNCSLKLHTRAMLSCSSE